MTIAFSVYPCVYREHIGIVSVVPVNDGLSLCVQGTLVEHYQIDLVCRFIPVCTGNTSNFLFLCSSMTVYPCVYREHRFNMNDAEAKDGLSLCVQGTLSIALKCDAQWRFIPVCTGNTLQSHC